MKASILKTQSFNYGLKVIKLCQWLIHNHQYQLSESLLTHSQQLQELVDQLPRPGQRIIEADKESVGLSHSIHSNQNCLQQALVVPLVVEPMQHLISETQELLSRMYLAAS